MTGLDWPTGFERTEPVNRERTTKFQASIASTTSAIETEMGRLDPSNWKVSTGSGGAHTKRSGLPKHSANPSDPGVVLRWTKDGEQFAVACDAYAKLRDNLRSVYLWVHETRMRSQRPVETGESEFAAARLPPADEDSEAVVAAAEPAHEVLEVAPDADDGVVKAAYREKLKDAHPDQGGSSAEVHRIRNAKEAMLDE
ncbi:J domain-containing protein [Halobacterium litoreum]|uniref:J domain-containing protein n=1 Tax=Halobacterium litoreum TaxID=2039234 RepID=A0ABD5NAP9_9EURY|nr:J domain-containing protein [Halobacterium litoreum]UHH14806.1 J domain-containing protein [Halobacterium litoreum]